jgi:steroid delta-isomerase-like uncharacterized protein
MSAAETAAVVRRYYDLVNHLDDPSRFDVVAPDAVFREPGRLIEGREAVRQRMAAFPAAFADLRLAVDDLVAAGDKAAVRWTLTGTHRGAFGPYPPTGKQVTMTGIAIHRVADGRMAEGWGCFDTLSAQLQLGATLTTPEQAVR